MPFDTLFKKFFPAVVLTLVALCAYFQASGISQLVATSWLAPDAKGLEGSFGVMKTPKGLPQRSGSKKTAETLLARNPFDSVTGPLNAPLLDVDDLPEAQKGGQVSLDDPLSAEECSGVGVRIITESTDPTWSLAVIQGDGVSEGVLKRVGDTVGNRQVAFIGFNAQRASPSVWLLGNKDFCQVLLFSENKPAKGKKKRGAKKGKKKSKSKKGKKRRGRKNEVPKEILDKIEKISATEYHVDRAVIDNILENQAQLMRSARIVPEQKDGKVVGVRLFGIRPKTMLGVLGMKNGDRLEQINGFDMGSPEKALEAYARLRTASSLKVKVTRRGKPVVLEYQIK